MAIIALPDRGGLGQGARGIDDREIGELGVKGRDMVSTRAVACSQPIARSAVSGPGGASRIFGFVTWQYKHRKSPSRKPMVCP